METSVLRLSCEGENILCGEIVFTVCRKLITTNKLISRYCLRINCIFTEVTGSDGSSSSDKGGHNVVYWIMRLISAIDLHWDALDNPSRTYQEIPLCCRFNCSCLVMPPPRSHCLDGFLQTCSLSLFVYETVLKCMNVQKESSNEASSRENPLPSSSNSLSLN